MDDLEVGMSHWATAPLDRNQVALFSPTLDATIDGDHSVRLFDEVLGGIDFSEWEARYLRGVGQPPIHPRTMAGCILYGMTLGIRSSRKLEESALNRLDFIWLLQGRTPDHATICKFRTQFGDPLKALFRKVGRVAIEMGMVSLNQLTLDGTALRASNSRFNTARRASLEQKLAAMDLQVDAAMKQAAEQDKADEALYGQETSPVKLPRGLKDLKQRQERLKEAMKNLTAMEQDRAGRGDRKDISAKGPAVPLADPDARVLPNKEGGYAPNYTGVLAVDSAHGIILDTQILGGNDEPSTVLPAVENIQESFGQKPTQIAADSGFNSGPNLTALEERQIEPLMPARQEFDANPALRHEASQPVPEKDRAALPMNPQNKILDKSTFLYDAVKDQYVCPMGQVLFRVKDKPYDRHGVKGTYQMYECAPSSCTDCPLAKRCLPPKAASRRVSRDEHEAARERMAARMKTVEGRKQYKRRAWSAETPFAVMKSTMNFRRFLLRGLTKAGLELQWTALAYNLRKIMRFKRTAMA